MEQKYHRIYRQLSQLYLDTFRDLESSRGLPVGDQPFAAGRAGLSKNTDRIVERGVRKHGLGKKLRPDARHFLLICVHQLLLCPVAHADAKVEEFADFSKDVEADVSGLLRSAEALRKTSGKKSVGTRSISFMAIGDETPTSPTPRSSTKR